MNRFFLIASFCIFFITNTTNAQLYNKSYKIDGYGITSTVSKKLTDGNILEVGIKSPTTQDYALFAIKLNPINGDTIWSKSINKSHYIFSNICADELTNGDIIIVANIKDSISTIDTPKVAIVSLNNAGNLNWSKIYFYPTNYPRFRQPVVKKTAHNNFIFCSTSEDTSGLHIIKMNSSGDTLFSKAVLFDSLFVTGGLLISDIMEVNNGYVFTGSAEYSADQTHFILFKTDTFGTIQWTKSTYFSLLLGFDAGYGVTGLQLLQSPDSNIIVGINSFAGLMKVSPSGDLIWLKLVNDTSTRTSAPLLSAFTVANDGGFYISGVTDFVSTTGMTIADGKQFIVKLDSSASIIWSKKYKFEKNYNNCNFITQLPSGDLLTTGTMLDTITNSNIGNSKIYLMRLDSNGISSGISCGLDTSFAIYPSTLPIILYNKHYHEFNGYGMAAISLNQRNETISESNVPVLLSVSIFDFPSSTICQGNLVTFNAEFSNGGTTPVFNFLVNGVSVQSGASNIYQTYSLVFPDTVQCFITSNALCIISDTAYSNKIIPPIYPTASPSVTISASPSGVITPGTAVTFTATTTNAGPTPNYLWKKNGIGITSFPTYSSSTLVNGDIITCDVTNSNLCSSIPTGTSNQITIVTTLAGINKYETNKLSSIQPNPAKNEITINSNVNNTILLNILDIYGRIVLSEKINSNTEKINISNLHEGLYFVELISGNYKEITKLIIEK